MTQSLPPPIPSLVPDTAPFSEEQRVWLNGFFAGLVSLDGFGVTPLSGDGEFNYVCARERACAVLECGVEAHVLPEQHLEDE